MKNWKIPVPAETAGKIEFVLRDPLTKQPKYGARTVLVSRLLEFWLDQLSGKSVDECQPLPSLEELQRL